MEVLSWLTKSAVLASAAVLAQMSAPSVLFPRAIPSIRSTRMPASIAAPALIPAPTAPSLRPKAQEYLKNKDALSRVLIFIIGKEHRMEQRDELWPDGPC